MQGQKALARRDLLWGFKFQKSSSQGNWKNVGDWQCGFRRRYVIKQTLSSTPTSASKLCKYFKDGETKWGSKERDESRNIVRSRDRRSIPQARQGQWQTLSRYIEITSLRTCYSLDDALERGNWTVKFSKPQCWEELKNDCHVFKSDFKVDMS